MSGAGSQSRPPRRWRASAPVAAPGTAAGATGPARGDGAAVSHRRRALRPLPRERGISPEPGSRPGQVQVKGVGPPSRPQRRWPRKEQRPKPRRRALHGATAPLRAPSPRERERFCWWEREREREVVTGRLIEIIQVTAKPRISPDIRFSSRVTSA